jgi:hypothetical protein
MGGTQVLSAQDGVPADQAPLPPRDGPLAPAAEPQDDGHTSGALVSGASDMLQRHQVASPVRSAPFSLGACQVVPTGLAS